MSLQDEYDEWANGRRFTPEDEKRESDLAAVSAILLDHEPTFGFSVSFLALWRAGVYNLEDAERYKAACNAARARGESTEPVYVRMLEAIARRARDKLERQRP